MSALNSNLERSLYTGFINRHIPTYKEYLPQLIVNDKKEGKKVLTTIIQELNYCDEFWFSVAFITTSGLATLIETLINLENRGVKGKILVSQYLNFTHPEALKRLLQFKHIELKIAVEGDFHSKGYLFKKSEVYTLIIGSSNLTSSALCSNIEWNLKITATPISYIIANAIKEFTAEYDKAVFVDKAFIDNYTILYNKQVDYSKMLKKELEISNQKEIIPNSMQVEALKNIEYLREQGKTKALLISATGTGKTFLSAFDVKKVNPKKFLFVVHRLNIAQAAMRAYQTILGNDKKVGVYSGNQKDLEADFIFSTVQTISKEDNLNLFSPSHFHYIVIDESHRSGADSYQKLINYFKPKFLLGMTATPERTDGADIFKLFDYNIAFEIRLHRALEENILSPFHYYGVTDITVDGTLLDETRDILKLASNERLDRIVEKAKLYGTDNGKVRGLIFCSSIPECQALYLGLNSRGLKTKALTGENTEEERVAAINLLENDELDYIITVDIFNEGIDIPSVNQIIMLRPTQSAIIFVQQLGRGLRKVDNKDYLTVIDFIGNYKNNFLVPVALYGDTTYNKDTLRKLMASGSSLIPGTSTINFDLIAREKIFDAINAANMELKRDLVTDYNLLKYKLGKIPMMVDFLEHGSRDPQLYVNYAKSYFNFVQSLEDGMQGLLSENEKKLLELFSNEINNSKRVEESIILSEIINNSKISITKFKEDIEREFGYIVSDETVESCIININFEFVRKKYKNISKINNSLLIDEDLQLALNNPIFKSYLLDNVLYSIENYRRNFDLNKYYKGLVLYNKYSRKDICRILNWPNDISSTVYGYRTYNNITPLFVTYHKSNDIVETINYNDHFIDQDTFAWVSRSNRRLGSTEIQSVINSNRTLLFIKKEDGEGSDFYYMGDVDLISGTVKESFINNTQTPVVNFDFKLQHPVEDTLYDYLTHNFDSKIETGPIEIKKDHPFNLIPFDQVVPYINAIPFVKAAAGRMINFNYQHELDWIEPPSNLNKANNYFVCQVIGESMNKEIPNGSFCLFKNYEGGSRDGKIVFAQSSNIQDGEFGLGYTIKEYHSKKSVTPEGWSHQSISLIPKSNNPSFKNIELSDDELIDFKVIGIFEKLL
ncbi:MAG: DUF3427 domain-containing protein [Sphingobacteriia bacterium]|jgi:superfamily II DNA or RNA helicase/HKD family nuclease